MLASRHARNMREVLMITCSDGDAHKKINNSLKPLALSRSGDVGGAMFFLEHKTLACLKVKVSVDARASLPALFGSDAIGDKILRVVFRTLGFFYFRRIFFT